MDNMVNGPASGGDFPMGKEYWEKLPKDEGFVPTKRVKVKPENTQHGEMAYKEPSPEEAIKELKPLSSTKGIIKLIKKFNIEQKTKALETKKEDTKFEQANFDHIQVSQVEETLAKIILAIPDEDMQGLTTKKAILDYIKAHPELKQKIEAEDTAEQQPAEKAKQEVPEVPELKQEEAKPVPAEEDESQKAEELKEKEE